MPAKKMPAPRTVLAGSPKHLELSGMLGKARRDFLLINISGTCNFNCKKCCNLVPNKRRLLSMPKIARLIKEAKGLGIRSAVFIGEGETILAPNFREIISAANSAGLYSIIFTNGYFLDVQLAEFLKENNTSIVFSVDSLEKEKYEMLVGTRNSFERVMKNISDCRKIFANTGRIEKNRKVVRLAANMLLMQGNLDEAGKLKEFCAEDMLPVFNYPMLAGNAVDNSSLFRKIPAMARRLADPTNLPEKRKECGYFFHGVTIGLDGSILACPYSLELSGKLPNIKWLGLKKAIEEHDRLVGEFRGLDRKTYCIMRSPKYAQFLRKIASS